MIKEAIEKIQQLANGAADTALTRIITLDGEEYTYGADPSNAGARVLGDLMQPPRPDTLQLSTLTGFVDAITADAAGDVASGKVIIHVEDYLNVALKSAETDRYGVRDTLLKATHTPINAFTFDNYYEDPQKFIIALQVAFLQTDKLLHLVRIASNLKAGSGVETNDDGFSQTITVKAGEVKTAEVKIEPRIKLIPLRSFAEANESNPVESEYLVRFKQGSAGQPSIALFAVDGQKYKGEIMRSIKKYLESKSLGIPILA